MELEFMMVNSKKVAYTLSKKAINIINERSILEKKSKSKYLSDCIKIGYEMMLEDYYDNDQKPLDCSVKIMKNTIKKTFVLPTDVVNELNLFSEKLGMKKSHLVYCCVLDAERKASEKRNKSREIDEYIDYLINELRSNL